MKSADNSTNKEMLEIVNESDELIGLEERKKIHQQGLLHRETHVWFFTPKGEIIFQHRAKDKETYPDLLDATVGGHVEPGDSYLATAIKEAKEETGVTINPADLIVITKLRISSFDEATKLRNNIFNTQFAYCYKGKIEDLKIEQGQGLGFEAWPIDALFSLSEQDEKRFISRIISSPDFLEVFKKIRELALSV